ncbi:hypothetical protein ADIARSV_3920 [Arcticibacter svalbardensis MN12-7]|uniref:Uncharacterized protein n=1 Tax=Arcticibacter svalbardensis MN12-7 TaxID=1150600 RepID=R9GLX1_9SPHI|nr:hypothetical protein ADIARSV_3920 [Arcticibacter svalbardensis MN12-7]
MSPFWILSQHLDFKFLFSYPVKSQITFKLIIFLFDFVLHLPIFIPLKQIVLTLINHSWIAEALF